MRAKAFGTDESAAVLSRKMGVSRSCVPNFSVSAFLARMDISGLLLSPKRERIFSKPLAFGTELSFAPSSPNGAPLEIVLRCELLKLFDVHAARREHVAKEGLRFAEAAIVRQRAVIYRIVSIDGDNLCLPHH